MNELAVKSALGAIPADDRETWWRMAMAVKSELGEQGFDIWDQWSQTSESYKEPDALAVWHSIDPDGGVTAGTLFHEAKRFGWVGNADPQPLKPRVNKNSDKRVKDRVAAKRKAAGMLRTARVDIHPYLISKGFPKQKIFVRGHLMLMPMRNFDTGELQSLQLIEPDGSKKFLSGGRARGSVCRLGENGYKPWFCEGYATGLSVHHALKMLGIGHSVVVCFSAGNLKHVARGEGFVVADNDANGVGVRSARATGMPYWSSPDLGDANDFHQRWGLDALASDLRFFIDEATT